MRRCAAATRLPRSPKLQRMKHIAVTVLAALMTAALAAPLAPVRADSHGHHGAKAHGDKMHDGGHASIGAVTIDGVYVRASLGRAPNSAAYMTLTTSEADKLVAVETPAAGHASLHTHAMDDKGVMKMRPVTAIAVEPGGPTVLQPGGLHVMLMDLPARLNDGETIALTLTFEKAGQVTLDVPVRGLQTRREGHGDGHRGHNMTN